MLTLRPEHWRADLLDGVLWVAIVLGTVVCVPSVYFALQATLYVVALGDVAALVALAVLVFVKGAGYRLRAGGFSAILYLLGSMLLVFVGPVSQVYLVGFSVMTALLLGLRAGVWTVGVNGVTLLLFGYVGLSSPTFVPPAWIGNGAGWSVVTMNFLLINAALVLAVGAVVRALESGLRREAAARTSLQQSESFLRMASQVGRMGAWSLSLPHRVLAWSSETRMLHDLDEGAPTPSLEEAIQRYVQEDRSLFLEDLERCAATGAPFDRVLALETGRRGRCWLRVIGQAVREGVDSTIIGVQGTFQDISAQQEAEHALRESEARFRTLCEASTDAIWDWDLETDAFWWNEGIEALFGHGAASNEPSSTSWSARLHPQDAARVTSGLQQVIQDGGTRWSGEYQFRRGDGSYAHVLGRVHVLRQGDGHPVRAIGGMTDLTARRASEARLTELADVLEKAQDAVLVRDLAGQVRFLNPQAARLYGWDREQAIGRDLRDLPGGDWEALQRAHDATLRDGAWIGEIALVTGGGATVLLEGRWTLLRRASGDPYGVLAILTDITERKQLEEHLLRAQRLESIGTLAGGIAHDLNNVLTPILTSIAFLQESETDAEKLHDLQVLAKSAQRGASMVRQLLLFARGSGGGSDARTHVPVQVPRIVQEVLEMVRETFPKNVHALLTTGEAVWPVRADPTQLHQLLTNLCVNARDAMPEGGQLTLGVEDIWIDEVYADMTLHSRPGPYVLLRVEDTGEGMPREILDRIFEPFFTTKGLGAGTGLGLSTCHTIARNLGGFIHVYSEVGAGTRFKIYLPADLSGEAVAPVPVEQAALPRGHGEVILVVDDEESVLRVTGRTLERYGYRVLTATNGAEALALYAAHRDGVAVVLTDVSMAVMDGLTSLPALRALNPAVKIIVSSGLDDGGSAARALDAREAPPFLPKPYTAEALLQLLRRVIG